MNSYFRLVALHGRHSVGEDLVVGIHDVVGACTIRFVGGTVDVVRDFDDSDLVLRANGFDIGEAFIDVDRYRSDSRLVEAATADHDWAPIFPFDVDPDNADLERAPNASAAVTHNLKRSPFGHIRFTDRFVDGMLIERSPAVEPGANVVVELTYAQSVAGVEDGVGLLERIEGGRVHARHVSDLLVVAGLYGSESFRAHRARRQSLNRRLAILADHIWSLQPADLRP